MTDGRVRATGTSDNLEAQRCPVKSGFSQKAVADYFVNGSHMEGPHFSSPDTKSSKLKIIQKLINNSQSRET